MDRGSHELPEGEPVGQTTADGYVVLRLDMVGPRFVDPEQLGNAVRRELMDMRVDVDGVPYLVVNVVLDAAGAAG